jgi:gliding motility-associated-like protein
VFAGLASGDYDVQVENTVTGCISTALSLTVNTVPGAPAAPTATITVQPDCTTPTGTITVTLPALAANEEYVVTGTAPLVASVNNTSGVFAGLASGDYDVQVENTVTGCISTATQLTVDPIPTGATITLDGTTDPTCSGDNDGTISTTVSGGTGPYTIAWTPNVGSIEDLTNLAAGTYDILVTDANGCTTTDSYTLTDPEAIAITETITAQSCGNLDGAISIAVTGGDNNYTYAWTPNGEATSSISGLAASTYGVTVTDGNGCIGTGAFTVIISGNLPVDASPNVTTISAGGSVDLTVTGATDYTWTPSTGLSCTTCSDPTATPNESTTYIVTGTDATGCSGSDTVLVIVENTCAEVYVPTIFSPNGEGPMENENLCVYGDCIEEMNLRIFNRWGEMVFETTEQGTCWDGTFNGKEMMTGNYVYTIYVKLTNNYEKFKNTFSRSFDHNGEL